MALSISSSLPRFSLVHLLLFSSLTPHGCFICFLFEQGLLTHSRLHLTPDSISLFDIYVPDKALSLSLSLSLFSLSLFSLSPFSFSHYLFFSPPLSVSCPLSLSISPSLSIFHIIFLFHDNSLAFTGDRGGGGIQAPDSFETYSGNRTINLSVICLPLYVCPTPVSVFYNAFLFRLFFIS